MIKKLLYILFFIPFGGLFGQEIPIGDWRDHLPYSDAVSVTYGDGVVYCATNSAVFTYDKSDKTIERLNLVNGLSDIGLSKIKFNPYNNSVLIGYANGNIDIIDQNKSITNLSFIKNSSSVVGEKSINHIYLEGKLAYLSTSFGIVVIDTDKQEVMDTYLFGPLGAFMNTNAVTMDATNIYAATTEGVYYANKNSLNLFDFNEWSLLPDLGVVHYSSIATHANLLFATSESLAYNGDSIYYNNSGIWQKFLPNGYNLTGLNISSNNLFILHENAVHKYDTSLALLRTITIHQGLFNIVPKEVDIDNEGYMLIAEASHGILRTKDNWNGELITSNGPSSSNVYDLSLVENDLWFVSGGYNPVTFEPANISKNLFNHKSSYIWETLSEVTNSFTGTTARDAVSVAVNPNNLSQVFMGTWDHGLFELTNGVVSNIFVAQNSVLDSTFFGSTKIGDLVYDSDNNLWITNGFANNPLAVRTPDNNWESFSFPGAIDFNSVITKIVVDKNNYKWMLAPKINSVIVFDDNGTTTNKSDDRFVKNVNVPGLKLHSILEDLDGEIWVGTDEGIGVFYNPSAVFEENITAEQIYIQQDGQTQLLLETEVINVITVDGANRKWIGTQTSGAYLMSEDGTEEIEHFTTSNSPLFSNIIYDIEIDPKTGEVYFATEKGLLSYKGTATDADSDFNNVFVYPNPVKPGFEGTIAIRGLVKDTDVRITDISGNIVYQTTSLGGQAVWDGKDFNGNKVQTGVYMVFNGSPEGDLKAAAKILIYH